jgi:hypothetical protein
MPSLAVLQPADHTLRGLLNTVPPATKSGNPQQTRGFIALRGTGARTGAVAIVEKMQGWITPSMALIDRAQRKRRTAKALSTRVAGWSGHTKRTPVCVRGLA